MATWGELSNFTWKEMSNFTWEQAKELTLEQLVSICETEIENIPASHNTFKKKCLDLLSSIAKGVAINVISEQVTKENLFALYEMVKSLLDILNSLTE